MQPRTHAFVIRAAVAASGNDWLAHHEAELLRGNQAEDDFVIFGFHLRAPGLTHSYKPGSRFGELGAPSAKAQLERWVRRARGERRDAEAAIWLGRACHLLGDMAVPARTRGVWHLLGDPLEAFWEASESTLSRDLADGLPDVTGAPGEHAEALALRSRAFAADTTRTPWGALRYSRSGVGVRLDAASIAHQARCLLPWVVAHTRGLLLGEAERRARGVA